MPAAITQRCRRIQKPRLAAKGAMPNKPRRRITTDDIVMLFAIAFPARFAATVATAGFVVPKSAKRGFGELGAAVFAMKKYCHQLAHDRSFKSSVMDRSRVLRAPFGANGATTPENFSGKSP